MNINLRVVGIAALLVLTMLLGIRFRQQRTAIMLQNYRELSAVATRVADAFQQGNDFGSLVQMTEPERASAPHGEASCGVAGGRLSRPSARHRAGNWGSGHVIGHIATVQVHFSGRGKLRRDGTHASI
jgi:hypothetical protein